MNSRSSGKAGAGILITTFLLCAFAITLRAAEGDTWIVFECNRPNPNVQGEKTYWDIWKLDPDGDGSQSNDSLFGVPFTGCAGVGLQVTASRRVFFLARLDRAVLKPTARPRRSGRYGCGTCGLRGSSHGMTTSLMPKRCCMVTTIAVGMGESGT